MLPKGGHGIGPVFSLASGASGLVGQISLGNGIPRHFGKGADAQLDNEKHAEHDPELSGA